MRQVCLFNEKTDIVQTQRGLEQNIPDALDYSRIVDTSVPAQYNGQKELAEIGSRIAEPFDVIEYDRTYTRLRKFINDSEKEKEVSKA